MGVFDNIVSSLPEVSGPKQSAAPEGGGDPIESLLRNKAAEYDIDPDLFVSLAKRESGLRPDAKNPSSSAGGLFQFIDGTWNRYGNKKDKFDPEANADAAARMLRDHLGMFDGDYSKALAAHHVGAGNAERALSDKRMGDKDVSTQQWLSEIYKNAGQENPLTQRPAGAFATAEPGIGGYDQIRRGQVAQAAADESPVSTSLKRGMKGLTHTAGLAVDNMLGDSASGAQRIIDKQTFDQENPAPSSSQKFGRDWDALADDDYSGMFGAVLKNPAGSFNMMLEQTPNSLPGMAFQTVAGIAGRGLMALGPVGMGAGLALQGLSAFAGNFLPEGGAFIEEQLQKSGVDTNDVNAVAKWLEEHRGENFKGGATKAGVISAVDGVTGWMGMKMLAGPSVRFTQAEKNFFAKNGINAADTAALQAARASDAYKVAMQPFAADIVKASEGFGMLKRGVGATALDSVGEGVGEYAGTYAATGDASVKEAVLEGLMSVGQGVGMAGAGYGIGKLSGPDQAMEELRKLAEANLQPAAAPKPNSPLTNAAQAAAPVDPFAEALQPLTERFADRALYQSIRNHPNLGPDAMTQILGAYRTATNSTLDSLTRQSAIDRLNEFFGLFDNPQTAVVPSKQSGASQEDAGLPVVPGDAGTAVGPVDPRAGAIDGQAVRVTPESGQGLLGQSAPALATDERARQAAQAEYEAAYQDLVKAEQLGASDAELMQRQIAARNAEARLREINDAIEANRVKETAGKRNELLDRVLATNPANPNRAFDRALRLEGFRDATFTEEEKAKIARFNELRTMQDEGASSLPNEGGDFGIREKQAPVPAGRYQHLANMLGAGWQLANKYQLVSPNGEVYNLKGAGEMQFVRNKLNPKEGNASNSTGRDSQGGGLQGDIGVGGAATDGLLQQSSGSAVASPDSNPAASGAGVQPPAPAVDGNVANAALGSSRLSPLVDPRIAKYANNLVAMAPDAGWAEEGGKLLRDANGNPVGRTRWIPHAEWFMAGMLNSPRESMDAVAKAIAGQPMYKREKLHVQGMMDFLDAQYGVAGESHAEELATLSDIAYESETPDVQDIISIYGDVDLDANGAWGNEVESMRALGFTEEEINEITSRKQGAFGASGEAPASLPAGEAQADISQGTGNVDGQAEGQGQEGFGLSQQTEEDLRARADAEAQAAAAEAAAKKAAEDKARADAEANDFRLSGSDRPADVAVSGGQQGLFGASGQPTPVATQRQPHSATVTNSKGETKTIDNAIDVTIPELPELKFFSFVSNETGVVHLTEVSTGGNVSRGNTEEEAIAEFRKLIATRGADFIRGVIERAPKIKEPSKLPATTSGQAQTTVVRTYLTKSGKVGARITKTIGPTGKIFYSYTGEWGAGSGFDLERMDKIEAMWRKEKRGFTVEDAAAKEQPANDDQPFKDGKASKADVMRELAKINEQMPEGYEAADGAAGLELLKDGKTVGNVYGLSRVNGYSELLRIAKMLHAENASPMLGSDQAVIITANQFSKDAPVKNPATLDEFAADIEAGYRVHYDFDGVDGRTLWIQPSAYGWTVKWIDDEYPGTTQTKGAAGAGAWDKLNAINAAKDQAKYHFEGWRPTAVDTSMREAGAKAFADGLPRVAPEEISVANLVRWLTGYDDAKKSQQGSSAKSDLNKANSANALRSENEQSIRNGGAKAFAEGKERLAPDFMRGRESEQLWLQGYDDAANAAIRDLIPAEQPALETPNNPGVKAALGQDVDLEETKNGLQVDRADRDSLAEWLASDQDPATGKPIHSEGRRRELQAELENLNAAVAEAEGYVANAEPSKPAYADDTELQDALSHLGDVLGDVFGAKLNITGKQYGASDLLPAMSKVIELLIKKGFKSFRAAIGGATNAMRGHEKTSGFVDQITPRQWKAAYNSVAEFYEGTEDEDTVAGYSPEQIQKIIALPEKIKTAEQETNHDATPGQKEAGNYAKGKFPWHGLTIAVETAKGKDRTDKETNGEKWRVTMPATYGYILSAYKPIQNKQSSKSAVTHAEILGGLPSANPSGQSTGNLFDAVGKLASGIGSHYSVAVHSLFKSVLANGKFFGDSGHTESAAKELCRIIDIPFAKPLGGTHSNIDKSVAYCLAADTKLFGDSTYGHLIRAHGFDSFDIKTKHAVMSNVISSLHDDKVFGAIVKLIPVDVMHMFIGEKFNANGLLHNKAMLLDALSVDLANPIRVNGRSLVDVLAASHPIAFAFPVAEEIAGSGEALASSNKASSAIGAENGWHDDSEIKPGSKYSPIGADKDHVDVFMGDKPESQRVYVINQTKPDSTEFDEHKIMLGYESEEAARADYLLSFTGTFGGSVLGSVAGPYTVEYFKLMLDGGRFKRAKPINESIAYVNPRMQQSPAAARLAELAKQIGVANGYSANLFDGYQSFASFSEAAEKAEAIKDKPAGTWMVAGWVADNGDTQYIGFESLGNGQWHAIASVQSDIAAALSKKSVAPGTRINGAKEKAAAERLAHLLDKMDQVRMDRNTPEGSAKGIVRSLIEDLRKPQTAIGVIPLLETASQRLFRQHQPFAEVLDQIAESLREDAAPATAEQAPASLSQFGLTVTRSQTKNGTPTWEVSGNTKQHVAVLKGAGGKWYGPKKVWSFYGEESPAPKLLEALGGITVPKVIALSDITVTRTSTLDGKAVEYDQKADEALSDIDDRMSLAKRLLECLAA